MDRTLHHSGTVLQAQGSGVQPIYTRLRARPGLHAGENLIKRQKRWRGSRFGRRKSIKCWNFRASRKKGGKTGQQRQTDPKEDKCATGFHGYLHKPTRCRTEARQRDHVNSFAVVRVAPDKGSSSGKPAVHIVGGPR